MAFMQRQVQYGEWIEVECAGSTCVFPADLVDDPADHWDDDAEKFDDDYLADERGEGHGGMYRRAGVFWVGFVGSFPFYARRRLVLLAEDALAWDLPNVFSVPCLLPRPHTRFALRRSNCRRCADKPGRTWSRRCRACNWSVQWSRPTPAPHPA